MDDQNYSAPQPVQPVQPTPTAPVSAAPVQRRSRHKLMFLLGLLLVVALAFGAAYFWQDSQKKDIQAKLDSKTSEFNILKQQGTAADKAAKSDDVPANTTSIPRSNFKPDLIPGNTDTTRTDGRVLIGAIYKVSLAPTAVWIEYGLHPDKINKATSKYTNGLGEGDPNEDYATGVSLSINNSDLQPGTTYYYRVAATAKDQTWYSTLASFTTVK